MQDTMEWAKKYYSEQALESLAKRQVSAETIEQTQRDWSILIKEVEAAIAQGDKATSPKAQALAEQWRKLIEAFTGGDAEIQRGLNKLYVDQNNWLSTVKKPYSDAAGAFMCQAMAIAKKK